MGAGAAGESTGSIAGGGGSSRASSGGAAGSAAAAAAGGGGGPPRPSSRAAPPKPRAAATPPRARSAATWRSRLTAPSYHAGPAVPGRGYAAAVVATEPPSRHAAGGRRLAFDYDRTVALSDGVFAIALTLLVLTIPEIESPDDLWGQLRDNLPAFGAYALSFVVLAALWRQHHVFVRDVTRIDGRLTSLNLLYLGIVAIVPYPTGLLAEHGEEPASVVVYAAALAAVTLVAALMVIYTQRAGLAPPRGRRSGGASPRPRSSCSRSRSPWPTRRRGSGSGSC